MTRAGSEDSGCREVLQVGGTGAPPEPRGCEHQSQRSSVRQVRFKADLDHIRPRGSWRICRAEDPKGEVSDFQRRWPWRASSIFSGEIKWERRDGSAPRVLEGFPGLHSDEVRSGYGDLRTQPSTLQGLTPVRRHTRHSDTLLPMRKTGPPHLAAADTLLQGLWG